MKKQTKIKLLGVFLLSMFAFYACEQEDVGTLNKQNEFFETVTIEEAQNKVDEDFIRTKSKAKGEVVVDWEQAKYEELTNTEAKIMVAPARVPNNKGYSRLLVLKLKGKVKKVLFTMHETKKTPDGFTGYIFIRKIDRTFIKSFKVENGKIVAMLRKRKIQTKAGVQGADEDDDDDEIYDWGAGCDQEVVIIGHRSGEKNLKVAGPERGGGINMGIYNTKFAGAEEEDTPTWDYNTGSSGSPNPTDTTNPYDDDIKDNSSPCKKASAVGKRIETKELLKDLKEKVKETEEHAYLIRRPNGLDIKGTHLIGKKGARQIDFDVNTPIDGYIHSHCTHPDGTLSIFSLTDIFAIAQIYKQGKIANANTFVAGVVTTQGTQYLMVIDDESKFKVFANKICNSNGSINAMKYFYNSYFNRENIKRTNDSTTNEKNFIKFIKDCNLGLKLLKGTKDLNKWTTQELDNNEKVVPKNCD